MQFVGKAIAAICKQVVSTEPNEGSSMAGNKAILNGMQAARPTGGSDGQDGLTKREEIAARFYAGLAASTSQALWDDELKRWAAISVKAADTLLAELARTEP